MNPDERKSLAAAYVSHHSEPHVWDKDLVLVERDNSATEWAIDAVMDIAYERPEDLWEFVLDVLRRNPPAEVLEVLAAGPLEDYLAKCGEKVIERVEERRRLIPHFEAYSVASGRTACPLRFGLVCKHAGTDPDGMMASNLSVNSDALRRPVATLPPGASRRLRLR
ncbi:hypothetical protein EEB15_28435 [Ramlibacter sp. WS9]|nr:hypothetical protein [Ramlibacter sp. WS9]ROZ64569.1 hypothetical protein EEB15_28435 [Ramlibacter sp. WS9]